ncbi:MAG: CCA tRNA nucleotidyltransferase [Geminicoccaceae bacterium]|nr:CCA tRNA nucleotidyltransferase [Geminicoccaceae bacterium]
MRPLAADLSTAPWLRAQDSRTLLDRLEAAGGRARFVGGCVRDGLLAPEAEIADLDVATSLRPEAVMAAVERAYPTGLGHGTVTVAIGAHRYEVTTLRRDRICDGRHAVVEFTDDFEEDAARRDFTINAMSCDGSGRIFDYFGGRDDLARGRLRFVGAPEARIAEDHLRILRFFRFWPRFGAGEIDEATLRALNAGRHGIDRLSGERLQSELFRLLAHPGCAPAVALMAETLVLEKIVAGADTGRLHRLVTLDGDLADTASVRRLSALLRGGEVEGTIARLRLSNADAAHVRFLCFSALPGLDDEPAWREAIYRRGRPKALDLACIAAAEAGLGPASFGRYRARLEAFDPGIFPLTGRDLIERGVPPGPGFGALLERLERDWIDANYPADRAVALRRLDRMLREADGNVNSKK